MRKRPFVDYLLEMVFMLKTARKWGRGGSVLHVGAGTGVMCGPERCGQSAYCFYPPRVDEEKLGTINEVHEEDWNLDEELKHCPLCRSENIGGSWKT